ncbi:MAG TPA: ABC transporter ATP-binding protein [Firmicutes bacterium]|nr:ABC transporter ATP-binding protein [Bacillota bacterium]
MLIEVRDLAVEINTVPILKGVNLSVAEPGLLAVVGPNGSGKTTLLRALTGILPSRAETLSLCDEAVEGASRKRIASLVSYIPQIKEALPALEVRHFLLFSRFPKKSFFSSYGREDYQIIEETAGLLDCRELLSRTLNTLSGGELQRIMIASALVQETPLIMLDEPTAFLDPNHRVEIFGMLRRIQQQSGKTILLVTHLIEYALNYAQRIVALKGGRLLFDGQPDEMASRGVIDALYEMHFNVMRHDRRYFVYPAEEKR